MAVPASIRSLHWGFQEATDATERADDARRRRREVENNAQGRSREEQRREEEYLRKTEQAERQKAELALDAAWAAESAEVKRKFQNWGCRGDDPSGRRSWQEDYEYLRKSAQERRKKAEEKEREMAEEAERMKTISLVRNSS